MTGQVASLPPKPAGPLSGAVFRALWIATVVSNIGTWMNDVAAGWLMTSLSSNPLVVALVQAATTVPMFLLALPAGAVADIVDRRKLLLGAQALTVTGAALLALATFVGAATPWLLLALTAMMAVGYALAAPAFQAIVPELVDREALQQAVTLNGLGINIARSIGPALAGVVIASSGPGAVFAVNAVSTCGVIAVLYRWKRKAPDRVLPAEHFLGAMRAGLRYALRSPELRSVILRAFAFFFFSSSLWALLPLIARDELGLGPTGYGGLLSFMGVGAILGALALPRLRSRMNANAISICASVLMAGALVALSRTAGFVPAALVLLVVGLAWIAMMSILNGSAQAGSPDWVKARALSVYLLVFQGSMAGGSLLWGWTASQFGIPLALAASGFGLFAITLLVAPLYRLEAAPTLDLAPSLHWPDPQVEGDRDSDRGPVLVTVEYRIDPVRMAEFVAAMRAMKRIRRRDGAMQWGLYEDASRQGVVLETFTVESWLEHKRQHRRITNADRIVQDAVRAFHLDGEPPLVRHFIAP